MPTTPVPAAPAAPAAVLSERRLRLVSEINPQDAGEVRTHVATLASGSTTGKTR